MSVAPAVEPGALEDALSLIALAKLNADELRPMVQLCRFADELRSDELLLVEVEPALAETLLCGGRVAIKGEPSEQAVLCTATRTYDVKDAETSNSLLLAPSLMLCGGGSVAASAWRANRVDVVAVAHNYLELKSMKGKTRKLRALLQRGAYRGPATDSDTGGEAATNAAAAETYTREQLQDLVQASDAEIDESLRRISVFTLDGRVRVLDADYESAAFATLLALLGERGWDYAAVPRAECAGALEDTLPRAIIYHLLDKYGGHNAGYGCDSGGDTAALDDRRTCRALASTLLAHSSAGMELDLFVASWEAIAPHGMRPALRMLDGIAVIIDGGGDQSKKTIRYFDVESLSEEPGERFAELFEAKAKWTLEEIRPFVEDLCGERTTVSALLTKHCRASTCGGEKVYSSKAQAQ